MKKTIAILLCAMMVLTTLSLPAMAMEGSATSYATIKDIVGADVEAAYTFDFSSGEMFTGETKWGISFTSGEPTFDAENGMTLTNGQYARLIKKAWWAPLGAGESGSVAAFTAKAEDEFMVFWQGPTLAQEKFRAGIRVTPEGISQVEGAQDSVGAFAPGTGWVDYLLVADTAATWSLYAKSDATDGKYILVRTGTYGNNGGDGTGLYFSAPAEKTFYVKSATIYDKILPTYDTVKDIVGEEIVSIASFDMTNEDYKSTSGFVFKPEGEHTQNGVFIDSNLGGLGLWRYSPQADWSPVAIGKRIATFTLKVEEGNSMEVLIQSSSTPSTYGSFKISPDAFWYNNFKTLSYYRKDGPGTDFVDYMIIAEDEMTISLYAKNLDGDGKWVLAARSYDYAQTNNATIGLYFAGTGYLKTAELFNIMDKSQIYDGIDDIIGTSHYAFKTFDFTGAKAEELYTAKGHDHSGVSFDNLNGMTLSGDGSRWRWSNYTEAWSAIDGGKSVYFKAKLNSAEEKMTVYFKKPGDETEKKEQAYSVNITADAVTSDATADVKIAFSPGTDWAEYIVTKTETGMALFGRRDGFLSGKWVQILHATETSAISKDSAVYFTKGGSVQKTVIYTPNKVEEEPPAIDIDAEVYDSVKEIMGKEIVSYKTFDMSNKEYQNQSGFVFKPAGEHTSETGAPIQQLESGNGFWRYVNTGEGWSPLTPGSRATYFKLKVEEGKQVEVKVQSPLGENKYGSFIISPTAFGENNFLYLDYARMGGAGTDWVEYLTVAAENDRIYLYAKALTDDGKWVLAAAGRQYSGVDNNNIGLYFAGEAFLKQVALYEVVDESLLYDDLKDIAGEGVYPYKDFKFTLSNFEEIRPIGKYDQNEVAFDAESGMTLSGDAPRWRFANSDGWSAIDEGRVVYFKAKADATTPTIVYFKQPNDTTEKQEQVYTLNIAATGVTSDADAEIGIPFAPGTGWAEYLVEKTETGMAVYARQDGFISGKWIQVLHTTATVGISKYSAVYFTKAGSIQHLTIYDTNVNFITKDTLQEIAGKVVASQYFDFKPGFDITVGGGTFVVNEPTIEKDGMFFSQSADWRFYNKGDKTWSPLDNGNTVVFKAKLSDYDDELYSLMKPPAEVDPEQKGKVYLQIKANGVVVNNGADVDMKFNFEPGTDWAEYLIRANENNGYDVWVKAAVFGNEQWYLLAETTAYNFENGSGNTGLRFRCNETCQAYVDYANVYTKAGVVEESATLPAGADFNYFEETFEDSVLVQNTEVVGMTVEDGKLVVEGGRNDGTFKIANTQIPKGGYAEFKTAGQNINMINFYDGSSCLQLAFAGHQVMVGIPDTVEGVGSFNITDGGNTFRIWRILRNPDGTYTGFSMAEGDGVWAKVFENKAPVADTTPAQILITAGNANIKYDYIKVYGPALNPENELTIYDGFGTEELAVVDGKAEINYEKALRFVVKKGDSKKTLILAEVNDGLLTNMVTIPVEAGEGTIIQNYSMQNKKATLKVLLWDDLSTMNIKNIGAQLTVK